MSRTGAFRAEAAGRHRQIVAIDRAQRRDGGGVEPGGPRRLAGGAQKRRQERLVGVEACQKRLEGGGASGESWSSMILADGKLYAPNQAGDVFVIRADPKFEEIATNSLDEPTNATLAASDGDLFLRTNAGLWCIGEKK